MRLKRSVIQIFWNYAFTWAIAVFLLIAPTGVTASDRVALVIGNAAYANGPDLKTPVQDAKVIAKTFEALGYETSVVQNGTKSEILLALAHLRLRSEHAEKVVVYFAGHGVLLDGMSFVVPSDAKFSETNLAKDLIPMNVVVRAISDQPRQKIIFFDACRDNPIYKSTSVKKQISTRSFNPAGLFVLYSSQPGAFAFDGIDDVSPFARAVIDHAGKDKNIEVLAKRIRLDVLRSTHGQQLPWSKSSLLRPAFLN